MSPSSAVSVTILRDVVVVTLKNPPVNGFSHALRAGVVEALDKAHGVAGARAVILTGGGSCFSAGADIKEFGDSSKISASPTLGEVHLSLEQSTLPVVAAIHGTALGGGLETALACHWRVAAPTARLGLPEVHLGILPGAGGTQRLPRLVGAAKAIELMTSGAMVGAVAARDLGLVDHVFKSNSTSVEAARRGVLDLSDAGPVLSFVRGTVLENDDDVSARLVSRRPAPALADEAAAAREKLARGPPQQRILEAPPAIVAAVEACCRPGTSFEEGMAAEQKLFQKLAEGPQAKALQHIFFAERGTSKIASALARMPASPPPSSSSSSSSVVSSVGIVGIGTMGGGIAMSCLDAGLRVVVVDKDDAVLEAGRKRIEATYRRSGAFKRGQLTPEALEKKLGRLTTATSMADSFGDVDVAIEAAVESLAVKRQIFADLARHCKPDAALCTNTSTLDIDAIAEGVAEGAGAGDSDDSAQAVARVAGTHFFSPANVMKLLEVVHGTRTSAATVERLMALGKALGKIPVLAGSCFGFIGNRMLEGYGQEAGFLVEEGCSPQQVDEVLSKRFGMAMGFFAMSDLAGTDVGLLVRREKPAALHTPPGRRYPAILDTVPSQGFFGQKTGKGWYLYDAEDRRAPPQPHPAADAAVAAHRAALPAKDAAYVEAGRQARKREQKQQGPSDDKNHGGGGGSDDDDHDRDESDAQAPGPDEVFERCLYSLANEGFKVLEEGIALRPADVDAVWVHGYGFPRHRGGPLHWADHQVGLRTLRDRLAHYHAAFPDSPHLKPAALLEECVEKGVTLAELWRQREQEESRRRDAALRIEK